MNMLASITGITGENPAQPKLFTLKYRLIGQGRIRQIQISAGSRYQAIAGIKRHCPDVLVIDITEN